MTPSRFLVNESTIKGLRTYVVTHCKVIAYCHVFDVRRHKCGYLNLDKDEWYDFLKEHRAATGELNYTAMRRITFQGISSKAMRLPAATRRSIPIPVQNFWLGVDTYGLRNPVPDDAILEHLCLIIGDMQRIEQKSGGNDVSVGETTHTDSDTADERQRRSGRV